MSLMKTDSSVVSLTDISRRLSPSMATISGSNPARPSVNTIRPGGRCFHRGDTRKRSEASAQAVGARVLQLQLEHPLRADAALELFRRAAHQDFSVVDDGDPAA